MKKAKKLAKMQLDIEKLKGYKIETEIDQKLCEYIGRFNLAGVSEIELRSKGLLRGNTLLVSESVARARVQPEMRDSQLEDSVVGDNTDMELTLTAKGKGDQMTRIDKYRPDL